MKKRRLATGSPLAWSVCLVLGSAAAGTQPAGAAEFTVDPERSVITLSGSLTGFEVGEQGPGSLTSKLEGAVALTTGTDTIEFTEGPLVTVRDTGSWEPAPNGEAGQAPANFGGKASSFLASAKAAARDLQISVTSEPLPLTGGEFSASRLLFAFPVGGTSAFDYLVTGLASANGRIPLEGLATNLTIAPGTLVTEGNVQTLTIPLDTSYRFELLLPDDSEVVIKGQLVATRTLGEAPRDYDHYVAAQLPGETDPAKIGRDADNDGDGWPNFVEFAFDLSLSTLDSGFAPLTARVVDANSVEVSYERPSGLAGVNYRVLAAADLESWQDDLGAPTITDLGNGREKVAWSLPAAPGGSAARFLRLQVEETP